MPSILGLKARSAPDQARAALFSPGVFMKYVLALDEGTTSARAVLFDAAGQAVALAQREFSQHYPRPGWVEHDLVEIANAQFDVAREALNAAGATPGDIEAIGVANQRETTGMWDRATGVPIAPAIVWQDRRTAEICDRWKADGLAPYVRARTGLEIDAYFSASKIAWMLDHVPGARRRAEAGELAFGTIDAWLLWQLTDGQVHATDATNASRTMLFDIHRLTWDDELLRAFNIPRSLLPEVKPSRQVYGEARPRWGLGGAPVAGVAGDQQAALFGQLCVSPGLTKNTYGTGCFMLRATGVQAIESRNRLITTIAASDDGQARYALEGSVFIAGAVVQWLRDGLKLIKTADDVNLLAQTVPDNGGVYLVPAFAGLGAPHWDAYARGSINGLTRGTTAGHLARAALEGIALQSADLFDAMRADSGGPVEELRVDGGACRSDLLLQFQADLLRIPVIRPRVTETTALGAAYLAGLAVGFWPSTAALERQRAIDRRFEPTMNPDRALAIRHQWARAVERARGWEEAAP
jgi:glycerol kinase